MHQEHVKMGKRNKKLLKRQEKKKRITQPPLIINVTGVIN